jgi:outer membrane protein assembly factor BamB
MTQKDYFTSDQVDEQIEWLLHIAGAGEQPQDKQHALLDQQLVATLGHLYQHELDRHSLDLVKQRLVSRKAQISHEERTQGGVIDLRPRLQNTKSFHTTKSVPAPSVQRKTSRMMHKLSLLAAVLLVGFLAGSWAVVTHLARTYTTSAVPGFISQDPSSAENVYLTGHTTIYKLNGLSGSIVWQTQLHSAGGIHVQVADGTVYAVQPQDIYAFNASNGKQLWHRHSTQDNYIAAIAANGSLYLCYSNDQARLLGAFMALNARDGSMLWKNTTVNTGYGEWFSVQNGAIYVKTSGHDGLYAIDAATGVLRWRSHETDAPGVDYTLAANGAVYDVSGRYLYALDEKSGRQLWVRQTTADEAFIAPRLANGILYVSSQQRIERYANQYDYHDIVHAFDAKSGKIVWTSDVGYMIHRRAQLSRFAQPQHP